jgi:hypothetical protein
MRSKLSRLGRWISAERFSPRDFVRHAVLILLLFVIAHLCGLREFTTIITGTMASPALGAETCALLGMVYLTLYFGVVVLVPVLLIAATLLKILQQFTQRRSNEP